MIPVVDVLLLAPARGIDTYTALRHLFALVVLTEPVRDLDRRFTSTPCRALIGLAFELGHRQVVTRKAKVSSTSWHHVVAALTARCA